ncbi:hypothetical protein [Ponticaulis sp.]|nr:hypothetical protein [Ponticaulis sp.]|tara:strand:- start:75 stop:221 length:147 start_codon:yes stop_codon:yes gene_type:complete
MNFQTPKAWWNHLSGTEKAAVTVLGAFVFGVLLIASGLKVGAALAGLN